MAAMFIAVQCCDCLTMQVKQQKKSSNKWTCAVCNQKQSVRKVYAQAYMAKEVRKFVQSFNMSRKFDEEEWADQVEDEIALSDQHQSEFIIENQISIGDGDTQQQRKKKRTDWSEYVDNEDSDDLNLKPKFEESPGGNEGIEPRIVTELPDEMFKKPKRRNYCSSAGVGSRSRLRGTGSNYYKAQQIPKTNECCSFFQEGSGTKGNVEGKQEQQRQLFRPYKSSPRENRVSSKWDKYTTAAAGEENNYRNQVVAFADHLQSVEHRNPDVFFINAEVDSRVEDDIHPDFM